ncbi:MAG: AAA family ATPase [Saprospiraceae bacterium]|nr:hypothetical protein [Lewinella sp.]
MQGIIFIGIQGSGKSTFYKENFFNTHVRISMDLLRTRNKEEQLLDKCLELQQRVVIDNTNPTRKERQLYIEKFRQRKYEVIGYYFCSNVQDALKRNELRKGKERITEVGILSTAKKMELPASEEGFSKLYYVEIVDNHFVVKDWNDEI